MTVGLNGPLAVDVEDPAAKEQQEGLLCGRLQHIPLPAWMVANTVFYALGLYTVMLGGRLDGNREVNPDRNDNFLAPAGRAFVIWPAIFLALMFTVAWQWLQWPNMSCVPAARVQALKEFSPWFCLGQLFMIAWCFTYTERFLSVSLLWISGCMLSGIAISLSFAHRVAVKEPGLQELFFLYPGVTMQFGWTTAAALLNFNTWLVLVTSSPGIKLAVLILCIVVAAVVGLAVGIYRNSMLYAGVICWALVWIGVNTWDNQPAMVEGLGLPVTRLMSVVEVLVGVGIVAAVAVNKIKASSQARSVEA